MSKLGKHTKFMAVIRPDVSVFLLISLFFQLIFPVVALSSPTHQETTFVEQLRNSICYGNQGDRSPHGNDKNTFVCERCLISCSKMDIPYFRAVEVYTYKQVVFSKQTYTYLINNEVDKPYIVSKIAPRSPPESINPA